MAANRLPPLGLGEARDWLSLHPRPIHSHPIGLSQLDPSMDMWTWNSGVARSAGDWARAMLANGFSTNKVVQNRQEDVGTINDICSGLYSAFLL